jgi:hypothetical protein
MMLLRYGLLRYAGCAEGEVIVGGVDTVGWLLDSGVKEVG